MVRGRTTAEVGLVLGHEITGEVIEVGRDVETLQVGDLVSLDDAPEGYRQFDGGAPKKFVIDPRGLLKAA
ncbi:threonine dehydrogenase-like Zn-dependent dehydrogenase [Paraburkholderia sp. CI2]|nr:threonine dehydrogenase-like Zn-dependent dehydrogenase [Paraburkholderia sp. CI2]